jgi:hypothetical protein
MARMKKIIKFIFIAVLALVLAVAVVKSGCVIVDIVSGLWEDASSY